MALVVIGTLSNVNGKGGWLFFFPLWLRYLTLYLFASIYETLWFDNATACIEVNFH